MSLLFQKGAVIKNLNKERHSFGSNGIIFIIFEEHRDKFLRTINERTFCGILGQILELINHLNSHD